MQKLKMYRGEMEAARRGGKEALVALYAAMVKSIDQYQDVAPADRVQSEFAFDGEIKHASAISQHDAKQLVMYGDELARKFFNRCVEVTGNDSDRVWTKDFRIAFCEFSGVSDMAVNRLGIPLRVWVHERLKSMGWTIDNVLAFVADKHFKGRESRRVEGRPEFYRGIRLKGRT